MLALGIGANRLYRRRTGEASARWMLTEDEAEEIGGALGRMIARRVPEQLVAGENGDLLVIAATTAGYVLRNVLELDEETLAAAQAEARAILDDDEEERESLERIRAAAGARAGAESVAVDVDQAPDGPPQAHVAGVNVLGANDVGAV